MLLRLQSLLGLLVILGLAWALSENRKEIRWRVVIWGVGLQLGLGLMLLLKTPWEQAAFQGMRTVVDVLNDATMEGASFVFGSLTDSFIIKQDALVGADGDLIFNTLVAFKVLPVIIVVSAISAVLYHLHVIQALVSGISWLMRRTLKTSGAETFGVALLIFLGIESVTAIGEYLKNMTRSEFCTVMSAFMATIAGSVMVVYASFGAEPGHLLVASLMSAPAAIVFSKIMVPETGEPETASKVKIRVPVESHNVADAAARGTGDGLILAINVGAMLITFIALISLLNMFLGAVTLGLFGVEVTFIDLMGYFFWPFAWLLGVEFKDITVISELLGTKTVLNEFLAYSSLHAVIQDPAIQLSERSITIATYALCGFANPGSLGMVLAVFTGLVPKERRKDVVQVGYRAFVAGTLACFSTACIAGMLI